MFQLAGFTGIPVSRLGAGEGNDTCQLFCSGLSQRPASPAHSLRLVNKSPPHILQAFFSNYCFYVVSPQDCLLCCLFKGWGVSQFLITFKLSQSQTYGFLKIQVLNPTDCWALLVYKANYYSDSSSLCGYPMPGVPSLGIFSFLLSVPLASLLSMDSLLGQFGY